MAIIFLVAYLFVGIVVYAILNSAYHFTEFLGITLLYPFVLLIMAVAGLLVAIERIVRHEN